MSKVSVADSSSEGGSVSDQSSCVLGYDIPFKGGDDGCFPLSVGVLYSLAYITSIRDENDTMLSICDQISHIRTGKDKANYEDFLKLSVNSCNSGFKAELLKLFDRTAPLFYRFYVDSNGSESPSRWILDRSISLKQAVSRLESYANYLNDLRSNGVDIINKYLKDCGYACSDISSTYFTMCSVGMYIDVRKIFLADTVWNIDSVLATFGHVRGSESDIYHNKCGSNTMWFNTTEVYYDYSSGQPDSEWILLLDQEALYNYNFNSTTVMHDVLGNMRYFDYYYLNCICDFIRMITRYSYGSLYKVVFPLPTRDILYKYDNKFRGVVGNIFGLYLWLLSDTNWNLNNVDNWAKYIKSNISLFNISLPIFSIRDVKMNMTLIHSKFRHIDAVPTVIYQSLSCGTKHLKQRTRISFTPPLYVMDVNSNYASSRSVRGIHNFDMMFLWLFYHVSLDHSCVFIDAPVDDILFKGRVFDLLDADSVITMDGSKYKEQGFLDVNAYNTDVYVLSSAIGEYAHVSNKIVLMPYCTSHLYVYDPSSGDTKLSTVLKELILFNLYSLNSYSYHNLFSELTLPAELCSIRDNNLYDVKCHCYNCISITNLYIKSRLDVRVNMLRDLKNICEKI